MLILVSEIQVSQGSDIARHIFEKMAQISDPHTENSHLVPSRGSSEKQGKGWEEAMRSSAPSQPFRTTCEYEGRGGADRTLLLVLRGVP